MSKRRVGLTMIILGLLALAAGLGLGAYNLWDNYRAGSQAGAVMDAISHHQEVAAGQSEASGPILDPNRDMPVLEVGGKRYIGTISIPALDINLPVQESWSLALLRTSPCRYKGTVYLRNMIICAHNYVTHFGRLKNILPGDEVIFTDVEGNAYYYTAATKETLDGSAGEEMESGEWDLTLFTCTLGGKTRVTVRCDQLENR